MVYILGLICYLIWLASVEYRWPIEAIELLAGWAVGAVGFIALDQRYPAFDRSTLVQRRVWFLVVVLAGLMVIFLL